MKVIKRKHRHYAFYCMRPALSEGPAIAWELRTAHWAEGKIDSVRGAVQMLVRLAEGALFCASKALTCAARF